MHPAALATIVAILDERRSGYRPSLEEVRDRLEHSGWRDVTEVRDRLDPELERRAEEAEPEGVVVIPLVGPIVPKADLFSAVSGMSSIEGLAVRFRKAVSSPKVSAVVLDVDSPGGSVDLVPEMAEEILRARGTKPIVAVADTWAASAAYWLASAADELVVTPSGQVGSIGVYTAHDDLSAMMAMKGIKTTLVHAGDYKVEANPFEPLDEEARAELQRIVDAYYRMFVGAVARQRGVEEDAVLERFGQGRMVMAADAVDRGMADRMATLDETVARLEGEAAVSAMHAAALATEARSLRIEAKRPDVRLAQAGDVPELVQRVLRLEREHRVPWTGEVLRRGIRPVHLRRGGDGEPIVEGYASAFDVIYDVADWRGSYKERVASGTFARAIRERADVKLLINHEDLPLARTKSGTLKLWEDQIGLGYRAPLDPSDPDVQRLVPKLERTDVAESSFSFNTVQQDWDLDANLRTLRDVDLFDVSIVTWPANPSTSAGLRAADMILALAESDPEELLVAVRSSGTITPERMARALEVVQALAGGNAAPADRDTAGTLDLDMAQREVELLKLRLRA
jgi:HK97 family phage prohead protease